MVEFTRRRAIKAGSAVIATLTMGAGSAAADPGKSPVSESGNSSESSGKSASAAASFTLEATGCSDLEYSTEDDLLDLEADAQADVEFEDQGHNQMEVDLEASIQADAENTVDLECTLDGDSLSYEESNGEWELETSDGEEREGQTENGRCEYEGDTFCLTVDDTSLELSTTESASVSASLDVTADSMEYYNEELDIELDAQAQEESESASASLDVSLL